MVAQPNGITHPPGHGGAQLPARQVVLAFAQQAQEAAGEHGMAIGPPVQDLLTGTAGRENLPHGHRGDLSEVLQVPAGGRRTSAREQQSAVTGIHHEQHVLGRDGFRDVTSQAAHRDVAPQMLRGHAAIVGHQVAQGAGEWCLLRVSVAREVDQHRVVPARLAQRATKDVTHVLLRRIGVVHLDDLVEAIFVSQRPCHGLCVPNRAFELKGFVEVEIGVDPHDHGPEPVVELDSLSGLVGWGDGDGAACFVVGHRSGQFL